MIQERPAAVARPAEPTEPAAGPPQDAPESWRRLIRIERLRGWLPAIIGVVLLAVALVVLHGVLRRVSYHQVGHAIAAIGARHIAAAILLTALSFVALVGYELWALRFAGRRLPLVAAALGAFVAQSVAHTTGFAALVATGIRYRVYVGRGLDFTDVAKVQAFFAFTFGLGIACLSGFVLLIEPGFAAPLLPIPLLAWRMVGAALLLAVIGYIVWSWRAHRTITILGQTITPPRPFVTLVQIALAFIDLAAAAAALWMLLPTSLGTSYAALLGMFVAALVLGMFSHVPGALGVFEGAMILLLAPTSEQTAGVIGALLAFRGVYYLLPFFLGCGLLGGLELGRLRGFLGGPSAMLVRRLGPLAPSAAAVLALSCGAVLLLSGATPPIKGRMVALTMVLPIPVIELAHLIGSLIGTFLLFLARPLQRRLEGAWSLALWLLGAGIVVSLLKGFDFEEAMVLLVALLLLLPWRREFYRRSRLLDERLSAGSWLAVAVVIGASIWVLVFAFRHVDFDNTLWWQVGLHADASRAMRATLAVSALCIALALGHLLRPAPRIADVPSAEDLSDALRIVEASPAAETRLALAGDKAFLFNAERTAFIMYGAWGGSWVAMGEPVGPVAVWQQLVWEFHEVADRHGARTVFYEVGPDNLPIFLDLGLRIVKLGERARVPLASFDLKGRRRQDFRSAINRAQRDGLSFAVLEPAEVLGELEALERVSAEWLASHKTREKRFSLGFFNREYVASGPVAVVRRQGQIVAFANLWLGARCSECSIDMMRYEGEAGPGIIDYLMVEAILWSKERGYAWFDLGMAPLSGLPDHRLAPFWSRLGRLMVRHGAQFYNFSGLRAFKAKFGPVWEPAYLLYPEGSLPLVLADVAALIGGGWTGIVSK